MGPRRIQARPRIPEKRQWMGHTRIQARPRIKRQCLGPGRIQARPAGASRRSSSNGREQLRGSSTRVAMAPGWASPTTRPSRAWGGADTPRAHRRRLQGLVGGQGSYLHVQVHGQGGRLQPEEGGLATEAEREALEETGLSVTLRELFYVYSDPKRDSRQHNLSVVFTATASGTPKGADDAEEARVFSLRELPILVFDHARILRDYQHYLATGERPDPQEGR